MIAMKIVTVTNNNRNELTHENCGKSALMAVRDALEVLSGTWKLQILMALLAGAKRFRQIAKEVEGISDKMLSKELKDLEINQLVVRTVYDTFPPTVEYAITEHTLTLEKVIKELQNWGIVHRKKVIGK
jgi:DNA-binding HxlR family transcriptional regulator